MPRNGSNIYSIPPGTEGFPDTTIESEKYNNYIHDVETDLNRPRPVSAGGTGADDASEARNNLDAEVAGAQVANYDTQVWEAGSFYSTAGATAPPVAGHAFAGTCIIIDTDNIFLEAHDMGDTITPGRMYVREKKAGVWGPWTTTGTTTVGGITGIGSSTADMYFGLKGTAPSASFVVNSKGDTTGTNLFTVAQAGGINVYGGATINGGTIINGYMQLATANPTFSVIKSASGQASKISGMLTPAITRWELNLGDNTAEGGGNSGSNFSIYRYADGGAYIDAPMTINRQTGMIVLSGQIRTNDTVVANTTVAVNAVGTGNSYFALCNNAGAPQSTLNWSFVDGGIRLTQTGGDMRLKVGGGMELGTGFSGRAGSSGSYQAGTHNFQYTGSLAAWVDATNLGNITITSDYRIKKDVVDLPAMWDVVKALRPVKYTRADYTPQVEKARMAKEAAETKSELQPWLPGDDIERWGFIAHELQGTMTPSVATGVKDDPNAVQSLNVDVLVAALTKCLQEAQIKIEGLEAKVQAMEAAA